MAAMRRLFAALLGLGLLLFATPSSAQAQAVPPSLQGEIFQAHQSVDPNIGQIDVQATCETAANTSFTLTYTASGPAAGPYPGTFTETGTVSGVIEAEDPDFPGFFTGVVTSWEASFSIDSVVGNVSGEKTLYDSIPVACLRDEVVVLAEGAEGDALLAYEATIQTATGNFTDQGRALTGVLEFCSLPCTPTTEVEEFLEEFTVSTGVLPVDTSGKATGGGQVVSGSNPLERVTFGFNVRKSGDETRLQGTCNVIDQATRTHVKCLTVDDYQQVGNTASWSGQAKVNGVIEDYEITVQDNGEPNRGVDMFRLDTETYDVPLSPVTHGNIQVHKQTLAP